MMRKLFALMLALMLVLTALPASAQSIFPTIPTKMTEEAPNYGLLMNVTPAKEETLKDGSLQQFFRGVSQDNFNKFGVYLGEKGYTLPNSEYVGTSALSADVVKDDIAFKVLYNWVDMTLTVTYPKDVKVEQPKIPDPFAGYQRLGFGEKVRVKNTDTGANIGDVTITAFNLNKEIKAKAKYSSGNWWDQGSFFTSIQGTFNNVSTGLVKLRDIYDVQLHYINADNHYVYGAKEFGFEGYKCEVEIDVGQSLSAKEIYFWFNASRYSSVYYTGVSCASLSRMDIGSVFDVPEVVRTSTDGILALTFSFAGNSTPYVLYIRNPNEQ